MGTSSRFLPLLIAIGAGLAVIGALFATGVIRLGGRTGDDGLRVPAGTADAGLRKEAGNRGPNLQVQAATDPPTVSETGIGMPDDVRKWLEHLKRIDKIREAYNTTYAMSLIGKVGSLRPGTFMEEDSAAIDEAQRKAAAGGLTADVDAFFAKLTTDFQAVPPPIECGPIAAQYASVLLETRGMLGQVDQAITNLDIHALESLQGTTFARLDTRAQEANTLIGGICEKYQEPNKYEVFVDRGNSLSLGAALMGGASNVDEKAMMKIYQDLLDEGIGQ
ncbi:MAG: hypothetical protein ABIV13_00455 [Fimbriimonadales bacterium]